VTNFEGEADIKASYGLRSLFGTQMSEARRSVEQSRRG